MSADAETNADSDCAFLVRAGRELIEHCGIEDDLRNVTLDPANVPPELHPLIPCAEVWGIGDDHYRGDVLQHASPEVLRRLTKVLNIYYDPIRNWFDKEWEEYQETERVGTQFSEEMNAFLSMQEGFMEAEVMIKNLDEACTHLVTAGRELIEQNGLVEALPLIHLDPKNVPSELHPLVPCAEVWNISDASLRGQILDKASLKTLRKLVYVVHDYRTPLHAWHEARLIAGTEPSNEASAFLNLERSAAEAEQFRKAKLGKYHKPYRN